MNRRGFLGALAAVAVAPIVASGEAPPDRVRFSRVTYGTRPYGSIGPYVEWRDRIWWSDAHGRLRWAYADRARMTQNDPDFDWIQLHAPIQSLAPDRDRLWLLTRDGWHYFSYVVTPVDETARVVFALAS